MLRDYVRQEREEGGHFATLYETDFKGNPIEIRNDPIKRRSQTVGKRAGSVSLKKTGMKREGQLLKENPILGLYGIRKNQQKENESLQCGNEQKKGQRWEKMYKHAYLNALLTKVPDTKRTKPNDHSQSINKLINPITKHFNTEYLQQYKQKIGNKDTVDLFLSGSAEHFKGTSKASNQIPGYSGFIPFTTVDRHIIK